MVPVSSPVAYTDSFGLCISMPTFALALASRWCARGELVGAVFGTLIEPAAERLYRRPRVRRSAAHSDLPSRSLTCHHQQGRCRRKVTENQAPASRQHTSRRLPGSLLPKFLAADRLVSAKCLHSTLTCAALLTAPDSPPRHHNLGREGHVNTWEAARPACGTQPWHRRSTCA